MVLAIQGNQDKPHGATQCQRATVEASVECSGLGIHSGRPVRVRIASAPFGEGITFAPWLRPSARVACHVRHAHAPGGETRIVTPMCTVSTVEHLLAACVGLGLTDARVVVDGPELPALDGSARAWVALLRQAGKAMGPAVRRIVPSRSFEVRLGEGVARWLLADEAIAEVCLADRACMLRVDTPESAQCFEREVAWARTFVRRENMAELRALGRGRGATWANTLFLGGATPPKMRGENEPLRHKLLDLVGDLGLLGAPWLGHVIVERGSHALHHALVRRCLDLCP